MGTTEINKWYENAEPYLIGVFKYTVVAGIGLAAGYFWARSQSTI